MTTEARRPQIDVVCEGRPRDRGLAQGSALRESMRAARECLFDLEAFILKKPRWLPRRAFRLLAEWRSRRYLVAALMRHWPEVIEQLAGLAEGAAVPLRAICLMNVLEAVLSSSQEASVPAPPGGCSAVAVRGSRSAGGEPILAQSFDYLPFTPCPSPRGRGEILGQPLRPKGGRFATTRSSDFPHFGIGTKAINLRGTMPRLPWQDAQPKSRTPDAKNSSFR